MSVPEIITNICQRNGWALQGNKLEVYLKEGRRQLVRLETFDHEGEEMIRLFSLVGSTSALSETRLRAALSLNFRCTFGALAIHGEDLVMVDTFLVNDADVAEVEASLLYLAKTADRYERMIYGTDDN